MACNFELALKGTPSDFIRLAKKVITSQKGTFDGDEETGSFFIPIIIGNVEGSYKIKENNASITVSKKPMMISCDKIEHVLRSYLDK